MTSPLYIPLRNHTPYSLAEGAIFPDGLAKKLAGWGIPAAGITDTNSISAAYPASGSLVKAGVQPLQGVQIEIAHPGLEKNTQEISQVILIAMSQAGYEQICRFISRTQTRQEALSIRELIAPDYSQEFLVLTGGHRGPIDKAMQKNASERARQRMASLLKALGDRLYCEIQRQGGAEPYQTEMAEIAHDLGIACVATSEAWFLEPDYAEAHDALLCIADGMTLNHDTRRHADPAGYLKSPDEMSALFSDMPEALENTIELARRCSFLIKKKDPMLPAFPTQGGRNEAEELRAQSEQGLERRLADVSFDDDGRTAHGFTRKDYEDRLDYELGVIAGMGFPGYFLIVADFIAWAKQNDIPVGPGRGSGAGSLVAWVLTITDLDPLRYGLFFERFLNPERVSMPDFDIDFCQERRDEVIDYVREKYGRERVAQIGTLGKLQARAVVRDVGRVMQVPFPVVDRYAKLIPQTPGNQISLKDAMEMEPLASELKGASEDVQRMFQIGIKLEGLYKNQSTHAAGVVIGDRPIDEIVPTYKDAHGTIVTAFDMKSVEYAGLVKFDFLGLKTLDVIQGAREIAARIGQSVDLGPADTEDPETYEMLCKADAFGVFQLESPGMRKAMMQIQPTCIEDIVALVSLYRPGPMENIPTYARVKAGEEEAHYLHPDMEKTLSETHGIIVYQEQVMQLARDLAGYSLGGADMLRRAMGKKIASEMDAQRSVFQDGALERGIAPEVASEIFDLIARFANYGFNKSHAAAYAVIAFQTAYLRRHHAEAFLAASMNLDIHLVENIGLALENARRSGITCLAPDINASRAFFDVEQTDGRLAVRHGLAALSGVGVGMARAIEAERERGGPFRSIFDFVKRTKANINKKLVESLINAGALDSLHLNRNAMMTALPDILADAGHRKAEQDRGQFTMFDLMPVEEPDRLPEVKDWSEPEKLQRQFKVIGFYVDGHPISQIRKVLDRVPNSRRISDIYDNPEELEREISIGAIITDTVFRQTANKDSMMILKLSDETGLTEVLAFKETAEHVRDQLKQAQGPAARFTLSVSVRGNEVSLFVREMEPLILELF